MTADFLFDTLESLILRWKDLARAFTRLAVSLQRQEDFESAAVFDPTILVGEENSDEVGLSQRCSNRTEDDDAAEPKGRAELLEDVLKRLSADTITPTKDFVQEVIDVLLDAAQGGERSAETIAGEFEDNREDKEQTIEVQECRTRLERLTTFIRRKVRELRELQDTSDFTANADTRGIRTSVENLTAYPILTSGFVGHRDAGTSDRGGTSGTGFQRVIEAALGAVLGRVPRTGDTRSFTVALNQSFTATEVAGQRVLRWAPRSFAGQTELGGGVSGAQASLYTRAKASLDQALPILDGLYSLREDDDPELVDAARSIVRAELDELVGELAQLGGPRVARVDNLLMLLLDQDFTVEKGEPVDGHLGMLEHVLGLTQDRVNTLEEEANLTNFVALRDYVRGIRISWDEFKKVFGRDLGTQFVLLSRALSVTAESVAEVCDTLDSVFVGESERLVASFRDVTGQRVLVGELFAWITSFTSDHAPALVLKGGRLGVEAVIPTAVVLGRQVELLLKATGSDGDLPEGMRQPRVRNAIRELRGHLLRIETLASDLRRSPTPRKD